MNKKQAVLATLSVAALLSSNVALAQNAKEKSQASVAEKVQKTLAQGLKDTCNCDDCK